VPKPHPTVLFVCAHNAGRSQMAAALARHVSEGRIEALSAGSAPASAIDGAVVDAIAELGNEMAFDYPKPLTDDVVRVADVVVTMGCGDACPVFPGPRYLDWPIADPAGQDLATVRRIRQDIADHILNLLKELLQVTPDADAVAVITDIHANLLALQAALERIDELGIEQIYCGGDLVGYGPHPNEVCALIEERGIPTIYGNYDYAIARDLDDCGCAYVTAHDRELGQRSVEWTLAHTNQAAKGFMRGLPFDLRFPVGEADVHLVHGSPRKVNEYLFEDKPASL
jgi:protein-tyrosine-phosphatase